MTAGFSWLIILLYLLRRLIKIVYLINWLLVNWIMNLLRLGTIFQPENRHSKKFMTNKSIDWSTVADTTGNPPFKNRATLLLWNLSLMKRIIFQ
jgi:hypothetical protein